MLNKSDSAETLRKDGALVVHCCYLKIIVFKKAVATRTYGTP